MFIPKFEEYIQGKNPEEINQVIYPKDQEPENYCPTRPVGASCAHSHITMLMKTCDQDRHELHESNDDLLYAQVNDGRNVC